MKTADDDGRYELHLCHCESCNRVRKAIQLDAMKEGMRRAALIKTDRVIKHNNDLRDAILTAAEQLTEKDL